MNSNIIKRAKEYIDKMANGINPLTDKPIPQEELLNNVQITRCLFYVSKVLEDAIKRENKSKKRSFTIETEELKKFTFSDTPISISEIVKRINALIDNETVSPLRVSKVQEWLLYSDVLFEEEKNGKKAKRPTLTGEEIGITVDHRINFQGIPYTINLYNRKAQEFIIDNFKSLLAFLN